TDYYRPRVARSAGHRIGVVPLARSCMPQSIAARRLGCARAVGLAFHKLHAVQCRRRRRLADIALLPLAVRVLDTGRNLLVRPTRAAITAHDYLRARRTQCAGYLLGPDRLRGDHSAVVGRVPQVHNRPRARYPLRPSAWT